MRTLPGRDATLFLVERYFSNVAWLFHHLHAPSFRAEVQHFHLMCDQERQRDVDPFWLALLLMVICLALDSMHYSRSPLALQGEHAHGADVRGVVGQGTPLEMYSQEQLKALPERWFGASMRALKLAEFETVPRIRSIQVRTALAPDSVHCCTDPEHMRADNRPLHAVPPAVLRVPRAAVPTRRLARRSDPAGTGPRAAPSRLESRNVSRRGEIHESPAADEALCSGGQDAAGGPGFSAREELAQTRDGKTPVGGTGLPGCTCVSLFRVDFR